MRCPLCYHALPFVGYRFKMKNGHVGQVLRISHGNLTIKKLVGGILAGGEFIWPENRIEELVWQDSKKNS